MGTQAEFIALHSLTNYIIANEILMYFRSRKKISQDIYLSDTIDVDKDGNALTLGDIIVDESSIFDDVELRIRANILRKCVDKLPDDREKEIIILRYGLSGMPPLTQREVAAKLKISRSYVSRLETKAIQVLKKELSYLEK